MVQRRRLPCHHPKNQQTSKDERNPNRARPHRRAVDAAVRRAGAAPARPLAEPALPLRRQRGRHEGEGALVKLLLLLAVVVVGGRLVNARVVELGGVGGFWGVLGVGGKVRKLGEKEREVSEVVKNTYLDGAACLAAVDKGHDLDALGGEHRGVVAQVGCGGGK